MYPLDLCKTKIQSDSLRNPRYHGLLDTAKQTYKLEGFKGFYRGYVPCICRTPFSAGATFATFEIVLKLITPLGACRDE